MPFDDGTFDTVVCQFGVMFFPDKDKSYREAYRVLASGGRYHFNVWDSFDFNPFARISHETVGGFFGKDVPAFYTVPFGYHRIDAIKASLSVPASKTSRCTYSRSTRRSPRRVGSPRA